MNTTFAGTPVRVSATAAVRTRAEAISWPIWAGLVSAISIGAGIYWDISWHEAIGRDTFWTPAHLLIQFGAVLAGGAAAWVIFRTTFSRDPVLRGSSVSVLGFRGPLGAFVSAWGGVAMVTSAPFDNWWHNAYGLDVKIISPPHLLLALGIAGINWGAALMAIAEMNRAEGAFRRRLQWVLMILGGFIVLQSMTVKLEYSNRVLLHSAISYMVISIGLLLLIEAMARVSGHRWARTIMAGTYMLFVMMMAWILPLFPAHPKLGPIYQQITHMVPLSWPILLVVPAFVLDLTWPAFQESPKWQQAFFGGVAFLAILIAIEWPFATFLMSPAARNWFFATNNYPYFALPWSPNVQNVFLHAEHSAAQFWGRMGLAFVASIASMWIGIIFGNWLKRVRR